MADISDKAKIRAIGRLVHWMFSVLVRTGVIEVEEAKRWIEAAQYTELIRSWPISNPKAEKEVASRRSKTGKSKRGKR